MADTPVATNKGSRLDFWWPVTVGVTCGVEIMLSALVLFGPMPIKPEVLATLTNQGRLFVVPENDLVFYAGGCVLTVLLIGVFAWLWRARRHRLELKGASDDARTEFTQRGCRCISVATALFLLQLVLVLLIQIWWKDGHGEFPWIPVAVLGAPVMTTLLVATVGDSWELGIAPRWFVRFLGAKPSMHEFAKPSSHRWLDVLVPILICALIYIPEWREYFGRYFQATDWCRHWSSFVVGPMLSFHYGKALGTEAYSQYGVGWPVVFSILHSFSPLTISRFVHAAMIYGCCYFIGVYVFLRLALGNVTWAAAGVLLAISLQLFHGLEPHEFLWEWPSSTILRSPMDIWFFIAALLHLRTGRHFWALVLGAFTGLAVFFETDTGIHLTLTFATYWGFVTIMSWQSRRCVSTSLKQALISLVAATLVLLAGLAIASRGTLLLPQFWTGWLEAILTYAGGMSMLPIAKVSAGSLVVFTLFIAVYLSALGLSVVRTIRGVPTPTNILVGCLGAYGLLALLLFVGRSETSKIFHPSVPFSLIITLVTAWSVLSAGTYGPRDGDGAIGKPDVSKRNKIRPSAKNVTLRYAAWFAFFGVGIWLVTNPVFRYYPGAVQRIFAPSPMQNLKSPPSKDEGYIPEFDDTVAVIRHHVAAGRTLAVLDDIDTVFYLAAGMAPWWRFSPSLSLMIRQSEVADLQRALATRGPDIVVIRAAGDFAARWFYQEEDVWGAAHQTVAEHYRLEQTVGNFEFWRRSVK